MNKLYYIANVRFPTERAHGIQIAKMCEAFADRGIETKLLVTNRMPLITEDAFTYYGVKRNFKIVRLGCLDTVRFGRWGFRIETLSFALRSIGFFLFRQGVFYTRDEFLAFFLKLLGKHVIWEVHMGQKNFLARFMVKRRVPLVVISQGLKDLYVGLGASPERVLVASDGVDIELFNRNLSKEEARHKLGIAQVASLIVYTGSRLPWKGVATLEEAARVWKSDAKLLVVSGKPHTEMPLYLRAADVLVLPNSATEPISSLYTSPMKLFEYMASDRPIVASNVPAIREVLDDSLAYFFNPDDSRSLADAVDRALNDPGNAEKARAALTKVSQYSWGNRAEAIMGFFIPRS